MPKEIEMERFIQSSHYQIIIVLGFLALPEMKVNVKQKHEELPPATFQLPHYQDHRKCMRVNINRGKLDMTRHRPASNSAGFLLVPTTQKMTDFNEMEKKTSKQNFSLDSTALFYTMPECNKV